MGDFNHGNIKWDTLQSRGVEDSTFLCLVQDNFLTQNVLEPTGAARLLDIVLSSQKEFVDNVEIQEPLGSSDHNQLQFNINIKSDKTKVKQCRRDFRKGNYMEIRTSLAHIEWSRLKKQVGRLRVVSWNVGTMTGKAMEIADVLRRRKVDIACVQEVKWKGSKARNVGHGYKLCYHGDTSNINGVGIILRDERTKDIVEISRISDRIILLKLACPNTKEVTTIMSAYAPQQGLPELEKDKFYEQLETVTRQAETVIIGGDLNGHVGMSGRGSTSHGNIGLGERNEEGDRVVNV